MHTFAAEQAEHRSGQANNKHLDGNCTISEKFGLLQLHNPGDAAKVKFSLQLLHEEGSKLLHSLQPPLQV